MWASRMRKLYPVVFVLVAAFFAFSYLQDGYGEGGLAGDRIKGFSWVALAVLGTVTGFRRWRRRP